MKNKICLILITINYLLNGVLSENIDHLDQGLNLQTKSNLNTQPITNLEDMLQILDPSYRKKRTINLSDTEDLYEFFLRQPLPANIDLDATPTWALQILVQLIKLNQNCAVTRNAPIPRPGRRSVDDDVEFERSRPPLSPRLGKKSVPFKPRLGRRSYDD